MFRKQLAAVLDGFETILGFGPAPQPRRPRYKTKTTAERMAALHARMLANRDRTKARFRGLFPEKPDAG